VHSVEWAYHLGGDVIPGGITVEELNEREEGLIADARNLHLGGP
jgi:hypothetical protein